MARFVLVCIFSFYVASAPVFGSPRDERINFKGINLLIQKLDKLQIDHDFSENYQNVTVTIERQLELLRGVCGEMIGGADKERCFRELITHQKKYLEKSHGLKKKYLIQIHQLQLNGLDEAYAKSLKDLERNF